MLKYVIANVVHLCSNRKTEKKEVKLPRKRNILAIAQIFINELNGVQRYK